MHRNQVLEIISDAVRHANDLRAPDEQLACGETTPLYGQSGTLDSLGLVSLILDVEEAVNEQTGRNLVLADERAMAQHHNPFLTVGSLANYIMVRLEEEAYA